jgi:hypothetical protein
MGGGGGARGSGERGDGTGWAGEGEEGAGVEEAGGRRRGEEPEGKGRGEFVLPLEAGSPKAVAATSAPRGTPSTLDPRPGRPHSPLLTPPTPHRLVEPLVPARRRAVVVGRRRRHRAQELAPRAALGEQLGAHLVVGAAPVALLLGGVLNHALREDVWGLGGGAAAAAAVGGVKGGPGRWPARVCKARQSGRSLARAPCVERCCAAALVTSLGWADNRKRSVPSRRPTGDRRAAKRGALIASGAQQSAARTRHALVDATHGLLEGAGGGERVEGRASGAWVAAPPARCELPLNLPARTSFGGTHTRTPTPSPSRLLSPAGPPLRQARPPPRRRPSTTAPPTE